MEIIQIKLFVVFLCSLSLIFPSLHAKDVKYCNTKNEYAVKVSGVEISPYPISRGKETTFTMSASTDTPISGGKLDISVAYFGWSVYSETSDLCSKTSCPVDAGEFAISHSESLPIFTPPGSYTLTMKMRDSNKHELTCIKFDFSIGLFDSDSEGGVADS